MKTEVSLDLLNGKTIDRVIMGESQMMLVFVDQTFAVVGARHDGWVLDHGDKREPEITLSQEPLDRKQFSECDLLDAEIITQEEIENYREIEASAKAEAAWLEFMTLRERMANAHDHGMRLVDKRTLEEYVFPMHLKVERKGSIWLYKDAAGQIIASDNGKDYWIRG